MFPRGLRLCSPALASSSPDFPQLSPDVEHFAQVQIHVSTGRKLHRPKLVPQATNCVSLHSFIHLILEQVAQGCPHLRARQLVPDLVQDLRRH
jgi:hypothetical protein